MSIDVPDVLKKIVARKKEELIDRRSRISENELEDKIAEQSPARDFAAALMRSIENNQPAVIAEVKKASPSKGVIRENFEPESIALSYERGGASCLSVLTDVDFFQGSDAYLKAARTACSLPVLRKDFTIDTYQITEARAIGADCILLIAAILDDTSLSQFTARAHELSLDVIIEVHNEDEMRRALAIDNPLVGINNRDLRDFSTTLETTERLAGMVPPDHLVISESGIHSTTDVATIQNCGVNSFLVGEAFMREPDPGAKLNQMFFQQ